MTRLFPAHPEPPDWQFDWEALCVSYSWIKDLVGCVQAPEFHGEGDVAEHTRMVCEQLVAMDSWRSCPEKEREILFIAALLHDVAKPVCTTQDANGKIVTSGHSRRGALMSRMILWKMGVPFNFREQVCALVNYHQVPFFLIERPDSERLAIRISQTVRCDLLGILAEADARGRICSDQEKIIDNVSLFVESCREYRCLDCPRVFPSDHSRFVYFRREDRSPDYMAHDDSRCEVVLMSGLPAAGKDYWIKEKLSDWPVVSLDEIRDELGIHPSKPQGPVVARARSIATEYLRNGERFVWNATSLSRNLRSHVIDLCANYRAKIRIVYIEVSEAERVGRERLRARSVPDDAIRKMLRLWHPPDLTEAHSVDLVVGNR